jgi:hypothetical protein
MIQPLIHIEIGILNTTWRDSDDLEAGPEVDVVKMTTKEVSIGAHRPEAICQSQPR